MVAAGLLGEDFFQDIVTAALKDVTGAVLPGSNIALALVPHVSRAFFRILERARNADQQEKLDALARVPFARAFDIAARQVANSGLDETQQAELVKYLAAIPMTSRQALHRWDDGGHVTTLLSQLPRSPEEMARFVPLRPPRFLPGTRVPGYDYQLESLLGQGGFAEVWKARNTELRGQPPVALKFCLDKELAASLRREITVLDRLGGVDRDKDFVQLLQTAYNADPPFLVYEYIAGGNLAQWLDSFKGTAPAPAEVLRVLKMTARAVAVAHVHAIVHRDLKPANLLVTADGRVKVADFGIGMALAKSGGTRSGAGIDSPHSTQPETPEPGVLPFQHAHTPVYSDPHRDRAAPVDPRDDVYALGVIGYQLLVGSVAARMEGGWRRYLEAKGAPAALVEIIDTCVAPPAERYVDAGALLAALEVFGSTAQPQPRQQQKPPQANADTPPPAAAWDWVKGAASRTPHAKALRAAAAGVRYVKDAAQPKPKAPEAPAKPPPQSPPRSEPVVKFCHHCGQRNAISHRFCTACGKGFL
jgi:serine/threonine protein kinase